MSVSAHAAGGHRDTDECSALRHLDLSDNRIGENGAARIAGVLTQCSALVCLNLSENDIADEGEEMLRASWRGHVSGLDV